jgi:xylose dehydrogenase (NAD/NADP)
MAIWGIIGAGRIARKFAAAVAASASEQIAAVASRDEAKAAAFASDFGIAQAYGSYEALLADPQISCIYNALPNALHAEWSIAAIRAGKHVLCEKPIASSAAEASAMFAAAREHGVWLMEAFMYRFHPQTRLVQQLLASGAIGELRLLQSGFSFSVADPQNVRLSAELAGGGLMDVGCYPVNFARMALGHAPKRVSALASWAASGVDISMAATLEYPSGVLATITCGLAAARHQFARIVGSQGFIEVDEPFTLPPDRPTTVRLYRGTSDAQVEQFSIPPANHFQLEAEGLSQLVAAGHGDHGLPEMPLNETLDNMATIEALLRSARESQPIGL